MKVINLFGGPNSRKSTTAYQLAGFLKEKGLQAELVTEFAKDLVWDGAPKEAFEDQLTITAEQHHRQNRLRGKCDIIVTDSPLLLGLAYVKADYFPSYKHIVREAFESFDNHNFYIQRPADYNPVGRNQTKEEAEALDLVIADILLPYKYEVIGNENAARKIMEIMGL